VVKQSLTKSRASKTIPCVPLEIAARVRASAQSEWRLHNMIANKPAVLYVDDNPKSRKLLATVFRGCGFEVFTAADPMEALRYSRSFCFNLVLLDYHLPVLSGPELAQKIKSMHSGIPIVMISSCAVLPSTELLFVDAHFGCDSSLEDLVATMRTLTGSQAVERNKAVAGDWSDST